MWDQIHNYDDEHPSYNLQLPENDFKSSIYILDDFHIIQIFSATLWKAKSKLGYLLHRNEMCAAMLVPDVWMNTHISVFSGIHEELLVKW